MKMCAKPATGSLGTYGELQGRDDAVAQPVEPRLALHHEQKPQARHDERRKDAETDDNENGHDDGGDHEHSRRASFDARPTAHLSANSVGGVKRVDAQARQGPPRPTTAS
jgi:hypothetical protein